mmetsp:Transcript_2149/g.4386  ORF Transcript_2149/g.4386 Transcript_2149/m.4386 type:complete len:242 (-) Transcript_2149:1670-2395(-)
MWPTTPRQSSTALMLTVPQASPELSPLASIVTLTKLTMWISVPSYSEVQPMPCVAAPLLSPRVIPSLPASLTSSYGCLRPSVMLSLMSRATAPSVCALEARPSTAWAVPPSQCLSAPRPPHHRPHPRRRRHLHPPHRHRRLHPLHLRLQPHHALRQCRRHLRHLHRRRHHRVHHPCRHRRHCRRHRFRHPLLRFHRRSPPSPRCLHLRLWSLCPLRLKEPLATSMTPPTRLGASQSPKWQA